MPYFEFCHTIGSTSKNSCLISVKMQFSFRPYPDVVTSDAVFIVVAGLIIVGIATPFLVLHSNGWLKDPNVKGNFCDLELIFDNTAVNFLGNKRLGILISSVEMILLNNFFYNQVTLDDGSHLQFRPILGHWADDKWCLSNNASALCQQNPQPVNGTEHIMKLQEQRVFNPNCKGHCAIIVISNLEFINELGRAYVGAACSHRNLAFVKLNSYFGLGEFSNVLAHEIAHLFEALHVDKTECDHPDHLMVETSSNEMDKMRRFSDCTIQSISSYVEELRKAGKSCLKLDHEAAEKC